MTPLIDGDILLHEIGWSGEFTDEKTGENVILDFDRVRELLDNKIQDICYEVEATEPPIIFLTSSEDIVKMYNRWGNQLVHEKGFRYGVAKTQPYKGNRKNPKPFHFNNIAAYMMSCYDVVVSVKGLEADDMMVIQQTNSKKDTIICSRDKDLRICEGWHYSWECGKQRAVGPYLTDKVGSLSLEVQTTVNKLTGKTTTKKKVTGYGLMFFYFQMLVGDTADYIPGLRGWGQINAYNLLKDLSDEYELYSVVKSKYKEVMESAAKEYFFEQANLLWMRTQEDQPYLPPKRKK